MAFTIPNLADVGEDAEQAEIDSKDIEILVQGFNKTGVPSGCELTAQGAPDITVAVAAGRVSYLGATAAVAGGNATIEAADGTNARFDFIMVTNAGALVNPTAGDGKGTAAAEPVFPTIPANRVVLAVVLVPALDAAIGAGQIVDKRVVLSEVPRILDRDVVTTQIVNTSDEGSLYSYAIPAGILGSTGGVKLTVVGDYLNNTGGEEDLQFRVKLGGVSTLLSPEVDMEASQYWRKWSLVVWFLNVDDSNQRWGANILFTKPVGDTFVIDSSSIVDQSLGVAYGTSSIDTTTEKTIDLRAKHSAAHAALNIVQRAAFIELLPTA